MIKYTQRYSERKTLFKMGSVTLFRHVTAVTTQTLYW